MKFSDNEVPDDVKGMYDEILRMREDCPTIKACLSTENMKDDPLSAFVMLAYTALRQKEMWREGMEEANKDLIIATL